MRWLFLSDLHVGSENPNQETAISSLVSAVKTFADDRTFDLVIITGDLAYSGQEQEYAKLQRLVVEPLLSLSPGLPPKVVAVPGNHDLNCDICHPLFWDSLGAKRQQNFFADSEVGRNLRRARAVGFQAYETFAAANGILTCLPTMRPVEMLSVTADSGREIHLACLNTAYFCDKEIEDKERAPAPVDALRDALKSAKAGRQIFVLGHHPVRWFSRDSSNHLRTLLIENNAVYLHGHEHEIESTFGPKGLVSLGFGAGYVAPLSAPVNPYYRNTFAICELQDRLHIEFVSWDSQYGSWVTETRLPADVKGEQTGDGRCSVRLPSSTIEDIKGSRPASYSAAKATTKPRVEPPIWIDCDARSGWSNLLEQLGELRSVSNLSNIGTSSGQSGAAQFVAKDANGRHLIRAFSAPSSTITYEQIEQANTFLDTEPLDSCVLATFGTVGQEALTLAARLKQKKSLKVLAGTDIADKISQSELVRSIEANEMLKAESVVLTPLIVADGIAMLVVNAASRAWFCVVSPKGEIVDGSSQLTFQVRNALPELRDVPFLSTDSQFAASGIKQAFDRNTYLARASALFDNVRYAGLAALGFRLPIDSLRKLYVPAAADVSGDQASREALKTAVDDFVEALNLDSAQKDQLEMQLRNYYGLGRSDEAGAASRLYQKYGAILVVGDPGSGKSCFVRYEILAYCQPVSAGADWYRKHTPIFLPLADGARIAEGGEALLDICVRFAASQRLDLTRQQLDVLLSRGEVAFFFDGIDEVGSLEVRQKLLREISQLIDNYRGLGNRFVVTSRPAATHSVVVPDDLVRLDLRGLTNAEIELLATRVMSLERTTGQMTERLRAEDQEVVAQLVRDCDEKPGIRRLARNPLLLTLLVLIYANSGPLAARRHVIYSQAVKTLVSVRHRSTRARVLSEADLRQQLGTLAIAIYRGIVSEIPSRREVRDALGLAIGDNLPAQRSAEQIDQMLQDVAESTGLVVIHPRSTSVADDVISFMHHSFLEYYAAIGFMREPDYAYTSPNVALSPRWREVITLMFGLLGEQGDISDFLAEIAKDKEPADRVTLSRLALALDCALECDVPPVRAQHALAALLKDALTVGAASVVADARTSLADKVEELLLNTGSLPIEQQLIQGASDPDARIAAAHVDFLTKMPVATDQSLDLKKAITNAFERKDAVVRIACIGALQAVPTLRQEKNLDELVFTLDRGAVTERQAALQLLVSEPALISRFAESVIDLLNHDNRVISSFAARCVLIGGIFARNEYENRGLLGKALRIHTQSDTPQKGLGQFLNFSIDRLEAMLFSSSPQEQILGIRCLVAIQREPAAVHDYLFRLLRTSQDHEVRSACLDVMAVEPRLIRIASLADTDLVCKLASDRHADVRRSAAKALRYFPTIDFVRDTLFERYEALRTDGPESERAAVVRALSTHGIRNREVREFLDAELIRTLARGGDGWGSRRKSLVTWLLHACDQMASSLDAKGSSVLYEIAADYRTPADIKRVTIRVFGRTAAPTVENGHRLLTFLDRPLRPERISAYKAAISYVEKCRGNVDTVRSLHSTLETLRNALVKKWDNESTGLRDRIDFSGLRDIRAALLALEEVLTSYREFATRMKADEYERQASLDLK